MILLCLRLRSQNESTQQFVGPEIVKVPYDFPLIPHTDIACRVTMLLAFYYINVFMSPLRNFGPNLCNQATFTSQLLLRTPIHPLTPWGLTFHPKCPYVEFCPSRFRQMQMHSCTFLHINDRINIYQSHTKINRLPVCFRMNTRKKIDT